MPIGTLAQEAAKKSKFDSSGLELTTKDRAICEIAQDAITEAVAAIPVQPALIWSPFTTESGTVFLPGPSALYPNGAVLVTYAQGATPYPSTPQYVVSINTNIGVEGNGFKIKYSNGSTYLTVSHVVSGWYLILSYGTPS
jgi:hypothetical protein